MQRSSSMTRVADDYYKNLLSSSSPEISAADAAADTNLPMYSPGSHAAKKEKSRLRSAENAVHLIPLVLLLCAIILWFFSSNPVDVVNKKPGSVVAKVEGLEVAGGINIDGTQNNLMPHVELEDVDLLHHHHHHHHNHHHHHRGASGRNPSV